MRTPVTKILGIPFWAKDCESLLRVLDENGGTLTVPSAPSLAQADKDTILLRAYQKCDYAVVDGGYIAIILKFAFGHSLPRISGLQIISKLFIEEPSAIPTHERRILWVVPNTEEQSRIEKLLVEKQFKQENHRYYLAPFYSSDDAFKDQTLATTIDEFEAEWVILCIGGGRQEKLAYWLGGEQALCKRRPAVLCTGAAIAFFTGGQASIPGWADRLYLGWFFRILENPKLYFPRYFDAFYGLPRMLWRRRKELEKR